MTDFGMNDPSPDNFGMMDPAYQAPGVIPAINTGVNWLGTQFTKGVTGALGASRGIGELNQRIAEWGGEKLGAPEAGKAVGSVLRHLTPVPGSSLMPSTGDYNQMIFGGLGVPEVNAGDNPALTVGGFNVGKVADAGAQAIPAAAAGVGGFLPNVLGAATSEASGQATAGTPYELPARILGALPGGYIGARLTTPLPANLTPQQARAVALAKENGVPLSVAQETGRGAGVERFFSRMPGGQGVSENFAAKQGAVTDAMALKQAGYTGNELGQETMKSLAKQAGAEFDAAKKMPGIIDLTSTFPKVREAVAKYEGVMDPARRSPAVTTEAGRILSKEPGPTSIAPLPPAEAITRPPTMGNLTVAIKNAGKSVDEAFDSLPTDTIGSWFKKGPMAPMPKDLPELSSQQYQTLRKGLSDAVDGLYSAGDTNGAKALQAMRSSLDDAVESSLGGDKLAAWQQARRHYYNFKILEKAMNTGNASARSEGTLGTAALERALRSKQGDSYYRTTGGLNDVATIKGYLRDTFPNSGTPTTIAQAGALGTLGLSMVPPWIGQRIMTGAPGTGWLRDYLANQAMPNTIPSGMQALPAGIAPGMLTDQQRLRLMNTRGQ